MEGSKLTEPDHQWPLHRHETAQNWGIQTRTVTRFRQDELKVEESREKNEMLYSQYHKQPSLIVSATVGSFLDPGQEVLLTASRKEVCVWGMGTEDFESCPLTLLTKHHMFACVMACIRIPTMQNTTDLLLIVTDACKWHIVRWNKRCRIFEPATCKGVDKASTSTAEGGLNIPPEFATHLHPSGVMTTWRPGAVKSEHLVLVSYWMDVFHLFTISEEGEQINVSVRVSRDSTDYSLKAGIPGPETQLLHWSFLQPPNDLDFEDCPMVVLLFADASDIVQIECAAIKTAEDDESAFDILQGPWGVTNVQPTAHTVLSCGSTLGGGCLCLSPNSIIAVGDQGHRGRTSAPAHFLCATHLGLISVGGKTTNSSCWLLGTDSGEVHALLVSPEKLSPKCKMDVVHLPLDTTLSVPTAMFTFTSHDRTILLWATACGHTSVLQVEMPASTSDGDVAVPVITLLCSPFERSLGAVHHAIAIDELGVGETDLVLACGTFGDGCVRVCREGVGVEISVDNGPELHGCSRILPLALEPGSGFHSHLLFCFDEQEETQVLMLDGYNFLPSTIEGFDHAASSLLALTTPGGHIVQVTPMQVRVVCKGGGQTHTWSPRAGRVEKAAADNWQERSRLVSSGIGCVVAVGVGCAVYLLTISEGGVVEERGKRLLDNQVSALAVLVEGGAGGQGIQVAVAEWVSNAVGVCVGWRLDVPVRRANLRAPVRSMAWWTPAEAKDGASSRAEGGKGGLLVVGLGDGTACCVDLKSGQDEVEPEIGDGFRVGDTAVDIERMGADAVKLGRGGKLYLQSSKNAVWAWGDVGNRVHCARVCGVGHCVLASCLHTELMPDSLVWLNEDARLNFGQVGSQVELQWEEKVLGDTVVGMVHHPEHHCLIVQSQPTHTTRPGGTGGGAMMMLHSEALEEMWRMDLEPCQAWSAIAISETVDPDATSEAARWLSGLVFAASYVTADEAGMASRGSEAEEANADEDLNRKEVGIVSAFEVFSPAAHERRGGSAGEGMEGAGRAEGRCGMRLVGLVEVGPVVTALHVVSAGVLLAAAGGEMVQIEFREVGGDVDGGRRASRQGVQGLDELWVRCEMRLVDASSPSSSEIPGKMVRAVDGRDGTVWGVQVLGELLAYRAAEDQDPSKMKVQRRNLDCRELNELGELTCCRVLGDGRVLLGSAGGTLAVVDVEGAAPDDGVGADGGAMEGRCAVAVAVDLRCGAISSVLPGRMGMRAIPYSGKEGGAERSKSQPAKPDVHFLYTTAEGAVGSISFVDAALGQDMLKVFAALMVPFVAPKHRHAWPRRNQEQDGIGDGLSGAAAVDGEVLRQLLLSCASDAPVSPAEGAGLVPSTVALDVLKKAGVGLGRVRAFIGSNGSNMHL